MEEKKSSKQSIPTGPDSHLGLSTEQVARIMAIEGIQMTDKDWKKHSADTILDL